MPLGGSGGGDSSRSLVLDAIRGRVRGGRGGGVIEGIITGAKNRLGVGGVLCIGVEGHCMEVPPICTGAKTVWSDERDIGGVRGLVGAEISIGIGGRDPFVGEICCCKELWVSIKLEEVPKLEKGVLALASVAVTVLGGLIPGLFNGISGHFRGKREGASLPRGSISSDLAYAISSNSFSDMLAIGLSDSRKFLISGCQFKQ